jgi:peptidyl-prolyl cis-trans isomerase SurA
MIDRKVVLKELQRIVPDQKAYNRVRKMMEKEFDTVQLPKMAKKAGMSHEQLLEQIKREGVRIEEIRDNTVDGMMAQVFFSQVGKQKLAEPSRDELASLYEEHLDDFRPKAGVVWRHIEIHKGSDAGAAFDEISSVRQQLSNGADFAKLAKVKSKSPTAIDGGLWALTAKGSYPVAEVDRAIFSLPKGVLSNVIEGPTSYHLVRVEERSDGSPKPFSEVQSEVKEKLTNERRKKLIDDQVKELRQKHHVESIFENETLDQS